MVVAFDLITPETVPHERLFDLIQEARRIALKIEGVYDLAFYQAEQAGVWRCTVDLDNWEAWKVLQADGRFQQVCAEVKALGVQIVHEKQLERRV